MPSHRFLLLALALLVLSTLCAIVLAGVVVLDMALSRPVAVAALALSAVLVGGIVMLHRQLREARWDAGYRLR